VKISNVAFHAWAFNVFHFWNTVIFAVVATTATVTINLLSGIGTIKLNELDLPLLTFRQAYQGLDSAKKNYKYLKKKNYNSINLYT
jgi:hypothetical protein